MTKIIRRMRGLCTASVRDLRGRRVYCTRTEHTTGTDHTANGMTWGTPHNGILKITHED